MHCQLQIVKWINNIYLMNNIVVSTTFSTSYLPLIITFRCISLLYKPILTRYAYFNLVWVINHSMLMVKSLFQEDWHGRNHMVDGFISTYDISCEFEPCSSEVYSIQHYVIKFVSELRQVSGFLRFPPPKKLNATI